MQIPLEGWKLFFLGASHDLGVEYWQIIFVIHLTQLHEFGKQRLLPLSWTLCLLVFPPQICGCPSGFPHFGGKCTKGMGNFDSCFDPVQQYPADLS
eukprot:scaffold364841_cov34-Attheya_sp.AAC.1